MLSLLSNLKPGVLNEPNLSSVPAPTRQVLGLLLIENKIISRIVRYI